MKLAAVWQPDAVCSEQLFLLYHAFVQWSM